MIMITRASHYNRICTIRLECVVCVVILKYTEKTGKGSFLKLFFLLFFNSSAFVEEIYFTFADEKDQA